MRELKSVRCSVVIRSMAKWKKSSILTRCYGEDVSQSNNTIARSEEIEELAEINISISGSDLDKIKIQTPFKLKCLKLIGLMPEMTQKEFEEEARALYKCCLKGVRDLNELHLRRKKGLEILEDFVLRAKPEYFTMQHVIHIIWSMLSCIHHFRLRIKMIGSGIISWSRKREAQRCIGLFSKIVRLMRKSAYRVALNSILTFYKEGKLWELEFGCSGLIVTIFQVQRYADQGITDILFTIEYSTKRNKEEAKQLTRVLYKVIEKIKWPTVPDFIIKRFLNIYESSISPKMQDLFDYSSLKTGIENCIVGIIKNLYLPDLIKMIYILTKRIEEYEDDDEMLLYLGKLTIFTAYKYKVKSNDLPLSRGPFPVIFKLFDSKNANVLLIGLKVWQNLINRNDNAMHFVTPKIFYKDCDYPITIVGCDPLDKEFFKSIKRVVYQMAITSFILCNDKIGLDNTFQAIALTVVDMPCGYCAFCFVTVAMNLQEYALNMSSSNFIRSHHLHATVLSILTLICHIHKAEIFYNYVLKIMEKRAEWAPHLNPPLRIHYDYAEHHVLWNSADLFFEDWEVRYGLWKCFREKKNQWLLKKREPKQKGLKETLFGNATMHQILI